MNTPKQELPLLWYVTGLAVLIWIAVLLEAKEGIDIPRQAWTVLVISVFGFFVTVDIWYRDRQQYVLRSQWFQREHESLQGLMEAHRISNYSLAVALGEERRVRFDVERELCRMAPLALRASAGLRPLLPLRDEDPDGPPFQDKVMGPSFEWLYFEAVLLTLAKSGVEIDGLRPIDVEILEVKWGEVPFASYTVHFRDGAWRKRKDGLHDRRDVTQIHYRLLISGVEGCVYLEDEVNPVTVDKLQAHDFVWREKKELSVVESTSELASVGRGD